MATLEELSAALQDLIDECIGRARSFRFDARNGRQTAAVALLGTVIELASDFTALLNRRSSAAPKVVVRSLMEAYVDIINIAREADYLRYLIAAQLEQDAFAHRRSREPQAATNPYLESFVRHREKNEARAAEVDAELLALRDQGYRSLSVRDRFEKAGELDRYTSIYYLLCQDSHHNLKALERRHFADRGKRPSIVFFKPEDETQLVLEAHIVAGCVANAVAAVSGLLAGQEREMEQIRQRWDIFIETMQQLLADEAEISGIDAEEEQ